MKIEQQVLSDALGEALAGRPVRAAVFTTFTFDPGFFELEILPNLFDRTFSPSETMRRVQLEDCLRSVDEIAVFYDRTGLDGNASPATLDFRRIDVQRKNGIFHPKMVLILVENPSDSDRSDDPPPRSLIVACLSANLTRSGWWENVETGHIEIIEGAEHTREVCTYRDDVLALIRQLDRLAGKSEQSRALEAIRHFLKREAPQENRSQARTKGRYYTRLFVGQAPLAEWLESLRFHKKTWHLEVVAPYFDANGSSALESLIETIRPDSVRVFLPETPDGTPAVTEEQYQGVGAVAEWGRLESSLLRSTSRGESLPRRVHAKVYRFWNDEGHEVLLVGSVNLTHAAHGRARAGNLEAAFFVDTGTSNEHARPWLKPLDEAPAEFPEAADFEGEDGEQVAARLSLRFDWQRECLEYRLAAPAAAPIEIVRMAEPDGAPLLTVPADPPVDTWHSASPAESHTIQDLLRSGSLLLARSAGHRWRVLVREEGMIHKPSHFDRLTPEEILRYWSLLSAEQREAFLDGILDRHATLEGLPVGSRKPTPIETVFDQFAGIYHAFERLRIWVEERLESGTPTDTREACARLFGARYDALPVLLAKVLEHDRDAVRRYVTFLSARQLRERIAARYPEFWDARRDEARQLDRSLGALEELRSALELPGDDAAAFLAWYEDAFLLPASPDETEEAPA